MYSVNALLVRLDCIGSRDVRYVQAVLEIALELGSFPEDIYILAARKVGVSVATLTRGLSRIAPVLWEAGSGIFHRPNSPCPKPKTVLKRMVAKLSNREIIC